MRVLITGSNGQLGRALQAVFPGSIYTDVDTLDITDPEAMTNLNLEGISAIINAAAYTNVDGAELPENQETLQAINVTGVGHLAGRAEDMQIPFVHISTDYVFDGTKQSPYTEEDETNAANEYGRSKVGSEAAARSADMHYIIRTSWVIGDGPNFVRTMLELGKKGVNPTVVNDQFGRPTFTTTLAEAIKHLLVNGAEFGIYNVTNEGEPVSWTDLTHKIYETAGLPNIITGITTDEYFKDKPQAAKRPHNSVLDLAKIRNSGFVPSDWQTELQMYVNKELGR